MPSVQLWRAVGDYRWDPMRFGIRGSIRGLAHQVVELN